MAETKTQHIPCPWSLLESLPMFSECFIPPPDKQKYCYSNSFLVITESYQHMCTFFVGAQHPVINMDFFLFKKKGLINDQFVVLTCMDKRKD